MLSHGCEVLGVKKTYMPQINTRLVKRTLHVRKSLLANMNVVLCDHS